ncbi:MAG TPA: alpha/beta hydrolase [Anaerolineae bacterium]|nr:alpha/beta hydrolase [Anaerolineae bacterium]
MNDTIRSADGTELFVQNWLPAETPVATLAIVHGLGEYSDRYRHVAQFFVEKQFAVYALDLRGHGRSGGQRGHIDRFGQYLEDVSALLAYARKTTPTEKTFLLGHSMGGAIVLAFALENPSAVDGVIASGPGLRTRMKVPGWKVTLGKVMSNVMPKMSIPNGIDPAGLNHDAANVQAYISDPLVHDKVSARWYTEFTAAGERILTDAPKLAVPVLAMHGADDPIVDPSGTRDFVANAGIADKKFIEYPAFFHEILNEPEKEKVLNDIWQWLNERIAVSGQ